eukprot:Lankesteria_metandrocarpae@DN2922_c0_g1_i1.p1
MTAAVKVDLAKANSPEGLTALESRFEEYPYVYNYNATQDDASLFVALTNAPKANQYPCLTRWYLHMCAFSDNEKRSWPKGQGVVGAAKPVEAKKVVDDDDDDFDPFAEETDADKEAKKEMAMKAKAALKPKKVVINRSTLVIDVKPNSSTTNLDVVEKLVREIKLDGVEWSTASKRLPIAYGLMKLQIGCTIVDDLINTDVIIDEIEGVGLNEEDAKKKIAIRDGEIEVDDGDDDEEDLGLVQSAEIVAFNKL